MKQCCEPSKPPTLPEFGRLPSMPKMSRRDAFMSSSILPPHLLTPLHLLVLLKDIRRQLGVETEGEAPTNRSGGKDGPTNPRRSPDC